MCYFSYSTSRLQRGFTLLELLVVIGLLGVVGIAATTLIIDDKEIQFQDATEKRWNQIRYAIIGDTSRTLNNEPMVSGYVADMGRLPANLQELTTQGAQPALGKHPCLIQITAECYRKPFGRMARALSLHGRAAHFLEMAGVMKML